MRSILRPFVRIFALLAFASAGAHAQSPVSVFTVNYPLAYFAERIGGSTVKVTFPVPRDVDPAFWNPDTAAVQAYQKADLILLNGADYARWVKRVSLPRRKTVDTSRTFRERYVGIVEATTHSHGPAGAHAHNGTAFVTWLDPTQAIEQARAVRDAFARGRPAAKAQFETGFTELEQSLQALDADLQAAFAPLAGEPLLASHPVYQYLARRYGLDVASVTWEPDEVPGAAEWRALDEALKSRPVRWMLWESTPRREIASRLKALGVRVIVFDPTPNVPDAGDFLDVMRQNLLNVRAAAGR